MESYVVRSPYRGEAVGEVSLLDQAALGAAADRTVAAFDATRRTPPDARAAVLDRAAALVAARREDLARGIAEESGKTIREARREADRCGLTLATSRDEARRVGGGEIVPLDAFEPARGHVGLLRRFPLGPVLGITPFNFPLNLVAHKVAPAIAAGCSILLKPATATPLSALRLAAIFEEAGAPPGAVTVAPCRASVAERLVDDPRFAALTFTGSAEVGWALRARAGRKKVVLELGGNAAVIVHEDADTDDAIGRIVPAAFGLAGQTCISVQRVYLHRAIAARATEALVARTKALRTGDPLDEATDMGPLIDEAAAARVRAWIEEAVAAGARLLCGGGRDGNVVEPTLLADAPPSLPIVRGEAFGPVAVLATYEEFDAALAAANDSEWGLQAGVFTRDIARAMRAFERLEVGAVTVNQVPTWRIDHMPYGGVKGSGLGREGPRWAIEDYTEPRLCVLNLGAS